MRISLVTLLLSTFLVAVMPWAGHAQGQEADELAKTGPESGSRFNQRAVAE